MNIDPRIHLLLALSVIMVSCQKGPPSEMPAALEGANLSVERTDLSQTVWVKDLQCQLESNNILANAMILGAMRQKAAEMQKCSKTPQTPRIFFRFDEKRVFDLRVADAHGTTDALCLVKVFESLEITGNGVCLGTFGLKSPPAQAP